MNKEASIGVVCGGRHISLHQMRNRQQQEKCQEPMNHCRPEKIDTKEHWKMLKRILVLKEGRMPDRNARGLRVEGEKKREELPSKRLREEFEVGSFMSQEGLWSIAKHRMLEDRGWIREYKPCTKKTFSVAG